MGKKKQREKDAHKRENEQVEEGDTAEEGIDVLDLSTGNKNDVPKSRNGDGDKNEKGKGIKKRKSEFGTDAEESRKSHKKHKKSKDVVEVEEISKQTTDQGSSEAIDLENNGEAERSSKDKHKKKKKQKLEKVNDNVADENGTGKENSVGNEIEFSGKTEDGDGRKKKKKKQKLEKVNDNVADENGTGKENSVGNEIEFSGQTEDADGRKKKKKKSKSKSVKNDSEGGRHEGDQVENATPKDKSKKVSFRDQVEVFPSDDVTDDANKDKKEGLVYGKRYSKEEDELVMNAVAEYIESHNLGDEGLHMVMNCREHSQVRNCWKEIQTAIPWRPVNSVYHRAHVIFERDEKHPWTPEELEVVQKFVEKHGRKWRMLADSLGKHRHHVKDTWRRIRLTNVNKGRWSQEEYQSLFDLVNLDLSMKANQERISKHGMLRDNICWTAISDKLETRPFVSCCDQWYRKLTSPMVAEGIWADADDYRMVDAISSLDACCMEDVDWDNLLEHRSGDLCRKRWEQMVRHLGPTKGMSFDEQVDVLAKRYRPDMAEARETYDSKRPIDLP